MVASTMIGIDIGEDHVHVVKLRRTGRGLSLLGMASFPTPDGAITGASIANPRLLADALRQAMKAYEIGGGIAVAGLPGRAAASRVLDLPVMSREELTSVIAGEMEHYRVIPANQGTFDFVPLGDASEESRRQKVLVMAADARIVEGYRDTLRLAGLQMAALEPTALAAARAAFPSLPRDGVAFITVGARSSELAVFHGGTLRYLRQLDVGAADLKAGRVAVAVEAGEGERREEESRPAIPVLAAPSGAADSFAFEIQRSIDFYHREAPAAARVERVVLCADMDQLPELDRRLEETLGLPVSLCEPFNGISYSDRRFNPASLSRLGPGCSAAVGLALRGLEEAPPADGEEGPQAPRIDLASAGPEAKLARAAPRWLTRGLVASVALVLVVLTGWISLHRSLARRQAELAAARSELAAVSQEEQERISAARRAEEARRIVQLHGLPWSDILLHVSASMPDQVWLTSVRVESGNTLRLEGYALSASSVATLMESFARSPLFSGPQMSSIVKQTVGPSTVVKYEVKVGVTPPVPPTPAAATATGQPLPAAAGAAAPAVTEAGSAP
jgi:type IV pilus assembly protein PilM